MRALRRMLDRDAEDALVALLSAPRTFPWSPAPLAVKQKGSVAPTLLPGVRTTAQEAGRGHPANNSLQAARPSCKTFEKSSPNLGHV
ncbi:hypothetical protein [Cupriavidus sp. BIC8F]|uniref:hypothetical protein n=1 Tax=Cupriavidus sp. BIC8F TaxID=3079014 RepID=UPI002916F57D|nr:hypothetical protein [Cupriavidus sp. BIC8F]